MSAYGIALLEDTCYEVVNIVFGMYFIAIFTAETLPCARCLYLIVKVKDFEGQLIFI